MNRDQATKWLEQVKPLLSHETREAIKTVVEASPCDVCRFSPPNKPCCRECPAMGKGKMVTRYYTREGLYYEEVEE